MSRLIWLMVLVVATVGSAERAEAQQEGQGRIANATPVVYPLAAKAAGIEGKVVLKGIIGKDGKMHDLRVIKGPDQLQQAALDSVEKWAYHPYIHNGAIVEVATTVSVNFTMGGKKEKAAAQATAQAALAKSDSEITPADAPSAPPPH